MSVDLTTLAIKVESLEAETAKGRLDSLAESGQRAEQSTGSLSKGVENLVGRLAALATAGAALKVLNDIVSAGREFGGVMAGLSAVTGATGEQLNILRQDVLALSRDTVFSATEIASGFRQIAADGDGLAETSDQISEVSAAAISLATATGTQLQPAIDAVTVSLRQFRATSSDAGYFAGILATLGPTADELRDVAAALNAAGDAAAVMGIPIEDVAGALQVLAQRGIEGSEAGTGLRMVMQELERQANDGLKPSVVGLSEALRTAADSGFTFEGRAYAVGEALKLSSGEIDRNAEALRNSADVTEQAARALDSLDGDVRKLAVAKQELYVQLSQYLTPGMRQSTQAVTALFQAFADLNSQAGQSGDNFSIVGGAVKGLAATAYGTAVGFSALGESIGAVAAALAALARGEFSNAAAIMDDYAERMLDTAQRTGESLRKIMGEQQAPAQPQGQGGQGPDPVAVVTQELQRRNQVIAELDQQRHDQEMTAAARLTDERARAERDAQALLLNIRMRTAEDPQEVSQLRLEAELAAFEQRAQALMEKGALTEEQIHAAKEALREAHHRKEIENAIRREREKEIAILEARAASAPTEEEAEGFRLGARVLRVGNDLAERGVELTEQLDQIARIKEDGEAKIAEITSRRIAQEQAMLLAERKEKLRIISDTASGIAALVGAGSKRQFQIAKIASMSEAALNIPKSASDAYAAFIKYGPAAAAAASAAAVVAQIGNLRAIQSTEFGSTGAASGGGSGGGGGGAMPAGGGSLGGGGTLAWREDTFGDAPTRAERLRSEEFPRFPVADGESPVRVASRETVAPYPVPERETAATFEPYPIPERETLAAFEPYPVPEREPVAAFTPYPVPERIESYPPQSYTAPAAAPAPAVNVAVNVTNNSASLVEVDTVEAPDGTQTLNILINAVADNIAQDGTVSQVMRSKFGLQPLLRG